MLRKIQWRQNWVKTLMLRTKLREDKSEWEQNWWWQTRVRTKWERSNLVRKKKNIYIYCGKILSTKLAEDKVGENKIGGGKVDWGQDWQTQWRSYLLVFIRLMSSTYSVWDPWKSRNVSIFAEIMLMIWLFYYKFWFKSRSVL